MSFVKNLSRWGIKNICNFETKAPLSGQRALKVELIEEVAKIESGYGMETALTIDALRKGFRVIEIPVDMTHRETGRNIVDFIHRFKQFTQVLKAIIVRL